MGPDSHVPPSHSLPDAEDEIIIVFGPKTRLAYALLTHPALPKAKLVLISRTVPEAESLRKSFPLATVALRESLQDSLPAASRVTLFCCAAGPIHPRNIRQSEIDDALRDLTAIQIVIRRYEAATLKVLLISSVLALVNAPSRATYSGWKLFLEGTVAQSLRATGNSSLSVVYPGRLVEKKRLTEPLSLCYTGYQRLADTLLGLARRPGNSRAIIGIDSRLWLCAKRVIALLAVFTGRG
jgi:hypothetical protein